MDQNFKRTIVEVEILSHADWSVEGLSLLEIDWAITNGECSGSMKVKIEELISPKEMSNALIAQGSDPEFLLGEEASEFDH